MDLSDTRRLRQIGDETTKLTRLLADAMFDSIVRNGVPGRG